MWKKVLFLKNKFKPDRLRHHKQCKNKYSDVKLKNKRSRERYRVRKYKKELREYGSSACNRNVINLSSIDLPTSDLFALELGHGFVLTPNNLMKAEETLILEGFRFLDRLGKADDSLCRVDTDYTPEDTNRISQDPVNSVSNTLSSLSLAPRNDERFVKTDTIPDSLRSFIPAERELSLSESKNIKKEFEKVNFGILNSLKNDKKKFNVPQNARNSLVKLKKLVKDKVIDIRKVDKGQTILIIDYEQRMLTEEKNISKIAELCTTQESNWKDNKKYSDDKLVSLYCTGFVSKAELTALTGLIPGGTTGNKKNKRTGTPKLTQVISQKELFAEQETPYVYPLFKAHKLSKSTLLSVKPEEVHEKIPSRLVVGMQNCQLSRVQKWLEHLLTPISKIYGKFEHIKDSSDFLVQLETVKATASSEHWEWEKLIVFTVDVKALYPSVQIKDVATSLKHCIGHCTNWDDNIKCTLIDLICYTLKN